jgi:hypothetical protein
MPQNTKIQVRRGTSIQWCSVNPVLSAGEPGFETDTRKFKIGDGVTSWNNLVYLSFDGGSLDENIVAGNTLGSIMLSDYFDVTKTIIQYQGITGTTIQVPTGYDYAIYVDSQGNVTYESVTAGQTLTFKSSIVLGTSSGEASSNPQNWYYQLCSIRDADCSEVWTCAQGQEEGGFPTEQQCLDLNPEAQACPEPSCLPDGTGCLPEEYCEDGCCKENSSSSSSYTPLPMMGRNPMEITW